MTVFATLLIGGGVCYAEEGQTNYYYVDKTGDGAGELTVRSSASQEGKVALQIPATYAFEYVDAEGDFVKIKYNAYENGYVSKSDFNLYCKPVTSKWGNSPYFHTIALNINNIPGENITLYDKDSKAATDTLPKSMVAIDKVYGYYHTGGEYYFFVQVTVTVLGNVTISDAYVKASDTTLATFSKDGISDSAGYASETAVSEQPSSGDDSTLQPSQTGKDPLPASNNFERYLLIAVIAVLCVVIIILIFAPHKSGRKP